MERKVLLNFLLVLGFSCCVLCSNSTEEEVAPKDGDNLEAVGRQLVEEGRTMVHHAVKRFMIIMPAIFFKLGIAFTLLIVATLVGVNNGIVGFLILVVGLGSVLARLQEPGRLPPPALPLHYISSAPHAHHSVVWDRSDNRASPSSRVNDFTQAAYSGYNPTINTNQLKYSP